MAAKCNACATRLRGHGETGTETIGVYGIHIGRRVFTHVPRVEIADRLKRLRLIVPASRKRTLASHRG